MKVIVEKHVHITKKLILIKNMQMDMNNGMV